MKKKRPTELERWIGAIETKCYTKGCHAIAKEAFMFLKNKPHLFDEEDKERFEDMIVQLLSTHYIHTATVENPNDDSETIAQYALSCVRFQLAEWAGYEFPEPPEGFPHIDMSDYQ